ncbi:MAG: phosphotransferase [Bacilli bacterium]|nr:phosphotransferase [Bacilli bacterium]
MNFPLLKENILTIEEIHLGTSNETYLLNGKYIYRRKLLSDPPFFSPTNEAAILKAIEGKEIAPRQIAYDPVRGDKVESYLEGARWLEPKKDDLLLFAPLLRKLHSLPIEGIAPFKTKERYEYYKSRSGEDLGEEGLYKEIAPLLNGERAICHNDIWAGNALISNGKAYLIDFEFAGINSPIFDLASLISENKITDKETIFAFLRVYYQKNDVEKEYISLAKVMHFEDALWFYWAKCRYLATGQEGFLKIMESKKAAFLKEQ